MNRKLREYIDELFAGAPVNKKTVEVKEEILQNLIEKYGELVAEGRSEEAAYNIAVAGIGDVSPLLAELRERGDAARGHDSADGAPGRIRGAALKSTAIGLYILSAVPLIILRSEVGLVILLVLVAAATGLLIFASSMYPHTSGGEDDTMVEEFRQWREAESGRRQLYKSISGAVGAVGLVVYLLISFGTGAWHITWVVFPLVGAVNGIIKAVMDVTDKRAR